MNDFLPARICCIDLELYSSLEDYLAGKNQWTYCYFDEDYGFPGRCGEYSWSWYQTSEFAPTCSSSLGPEQDEVYWFLYDEDFPGEKYEADWMPTELSFGLPFLFEAVEDIEMEHVQISGAGANGAYSLSMRRPSHIPFKSLSIVDGLGNGISCTGRGSYHFQDLIIKSDTLSSGNGIYASNWADVSIDGFFISTKHSGNAIYAEGSFVSLYLYNGEIEPRSNNQVSITWFYSNLY